MPARKIVDEQEVIRWFEEGRTYDWMITEYRRKYDIDTVPSMWGNFRRRRGLQRRIERNDDLIPWAVKKEHRWDYALTMLRTDARRRAGLDVADSMSDRLDNWLARMDRDNTVVEYVPTSSDGFHYVQRLDGEQGLIRQPARKTTTRRSTDRRD